MPGSASVKEMVLAGLLLSSRDILGAAEWVRDNSDDPDLAKDAEKAAREAEKAREQAEATAAPDTPGTASDRN